MSTEYLNEQVVQYKMQRAMNIEEQKSTRAAERKKRGTQAVTDFNDTIVVTKKDTIQFIDKTCNVNKYRKMLKNESLQLSKKDLSKALNKENEKKEEIKESNRSHCLETLQEMQAKEQKYLNIFGFVNTNKYDPVEYEVEQKPPVEKIRVKNKQHKGRAELKKIKLLD